MGHRFLKKKIGFKKKKTGRGPAAPKKNEKKVCQECSMHRGCVVRGSNPRKQSRLGQKRQGTQKLRKYCCGWEKGKSITIGEFNSRRKEGESGKWGRKKRWSEALS